MATKKQQTLSSFFQKPSNSPTNPSRERSQDGSLGPPAAKRRRISTGSDEPRPEDLTAQSTLFDDKSLKPVSPNVQSARPQSRAATIERTSQYLFSPNDDFLAENDDLSSLRDTHKQELHRKFVRKLGRPESINEIKRRNRALVDEDEDQAADDENDEDAEPEPSGGGRGRVKKGAQKLTPMEKQVIEIKNAHPDTLLIVEVGYKFRFFGEDARHAARELGIVCIPGKMRFDEHPSEAHLSRFASASVPVHRLHVHVKRLVAAGHKVGVVRQLETAALKAVGDNRNTPFVRKLTNLYTKGTYVDEIDGLEDGVGPSANQSQSTGFLLCLTETNAKGYGSDEKVDVGIVAVQPATGDVLYDDFQDGFMRSEIETRLLHIAPAEFLIVGKLSKATEKLIDHLTGSQANVFSDKARVERKERSKTAAAEAHSHVSQFYAGKLATEHDGSQKVLDKILGLPEHVMICLSALIHHLADYGLDNVFDLTKYFQSFSARSHMLINGNTLSSLEIYQNQTDFTVQGSLFWSLDRTKTKFGRRLLRKWVGRPLLARAEIEARLEAVEELLSPDKTAHVEKVRAALNKTKWDLERSLLRVYYGKCTRPELVHLLQAFQHLGQQYADVTVKSCGFDSILLQNAIVKLPSIQTEIVGFLDRINLDAAKSDDKYAFFREEHETEEISDHKLGIASVEDDLNNFRSTAAEKIGRKRPVDYVTVAGIEYLIEVENDGGTIKKVPASWTKISGTKKFSRFHPPEVVKLVRERDQHREALAAACDTAFQDLLAEVGVKYQNLRDAIVSLAVLDCLMSLATIGQQPGYVRPEFVDDGQIELRGSRHPMIEQLLIDSYVPNDISLSERATRGLLVTGPNMGGKSSYVRSVALIVIMAQIGSFVPADSARLGIVDGVFTRMGAFDKMLAGESTFMVELSETSDILKLATNRSLVILDELGRGTSTHDGVAIAGSVLDWLIQEKKCFTLFITHYQVLARMADGFPGGELKNVHMRFSEDKAGGDEVTFLYEVGDGVAHRSYGLNVARLAGLEPAVIELARSKSSELEVMTRQRRLQALSRAFHLDPPGDDGIHLDGLVEAIEML